MTPEASIRAAFSGDSPLHTSVRVALLRVLHAGLWAETQIDFTADWLQRMTDDPPYSIWYGPETAHTLAGALRTLADDLDKAVTALDAAKPSWQRFPSAEAPYAVGIRPDQWQPDGTDAETPF